MKLVLTNNDAWYLHNSVAKALPNKSFDYNLIGSTYLIMDVVWDIDNLIYTYKKDHLYVGEVEVNI